MCVGCGVRCYGRCGTSDHETEITIEREVECMCGVSFTYKGVADLWNGNWVQFVWTCNECGEENDEGYDV